MGKSKQAATGSRQKAGRANGEVEKLERLPKSNEVAIQKTIEKNSDSTQTGAKVHKRALIHAPIPSPYSGKQDQKVIYMSSKTPIMSAFKRVKHLLVHVDKREMQSALARSKRQGSRGYPSTPADEEREKIFVKATGKVIDRALNLALFLQQQDEYMVRIRTDTVDAIDDIILDDDEGDQNDARELPESRVRHTSMLEVAVSLR